jgi:hypothetical protein
MTRQRVHMYPSTDATGATASSQRAAPMTKLIAETASDTITIRDEDGVRWWPSDEALEEIEASDDAEATAVRICDEEPMRGEWKS